MADFEKLEPVPLGYGIVGTVASLGCFALLHVLVSKLATPSRVRPVDAWKWKNIFLSWLHSTIVGIWILACFIIFPDASADPIAFNNKYFYAAVTFSTGYFFSDFSDLLINSQIVNMWEVTLHHIAVITIFLCNLYSSLYIPYTCIALLVEVNSIFLHLRKLMQLAGVSFENYFYQVNAIINLLTFVCFRFMALVWITGGMFFWYKDRIPFGYKILLSVIMFVMWIINTILFWRLLKSDVIRKKKPPTSQPKSNILNDTNGNNNFIPNRDGKST